MNVICIIKAGGLEGGGVGGGGGHPLAAVAKDAALRVASQLMLPEFAPQFAKTNANN